MKALTTRHPSKEDVSLELGKVLGQSIAFGTIGGRCSAAQAAAIRKARNDKIHAHLGQTWREFCPIHLKMSGAQADVFIRLLEEFGPDYFEHTQSVHISADTYRLVAPFLHDKSLHFYEEVLELNSANVQKVAKSVRESRKALLPPADEAPALCDRLAELNRRALEMMAELREISKASRTGKPSPLFGSQLKGTLTCLRSEFLRVCLENGVV
jgi:hypothetical protein